MIDKLKLIKALLSTEGVEMVDQARLGELEYWDSGNFDDCFSMGYDVGYASAILRVIEILENN